MTKTTKTNSGMVLGLLGSVAAYLWLSRRKRRASKATALPEAKGPFVAGSQCTELGDETQIERWLVSVTPSVNRRLDAFVVGDSSHADGRAAIIRLVDEVFAAAVPRCSPLETRASRRLWKLLWCDVVAELIRRGKVDEELDDVLRLCADPSFDPRTFVKDDEPVEEAPLPVPEPPLPKPPPMPPNPGPVVDPMDGAPPANPSTPWVASTREELSELGVMRMMEGTIAGAPINGPVPHVVLLAMSPFWPHLEQARADMAQIAAGHPGVSFVEVSFADTQRHFGKPNDLAGLMWVLTGTSPDGRAFPSPIARNDPRDEPPSVEEWTKLIAHASGFVGSPVVRRMVRPRRFGDLTRAMLARRRTGQTSARPTARPRRPPRPRRTPPRRARRHGVG